MADENHIKISSRIHIGVAVDIPGGLIVPVIRDANMKDLRTICLELSDLTQRAKDNKLTSDQLGGATITITNLGMFGITFLPSLNLLLGGLSNSPPPPPSFVRGGVVVYPSPHFPPPPPLPAFALPGLPVPEPWRPARPSLKCTFWSRAVVFNTSIISWVSLLAEPSRARLTVSPSFTILSTGATPEAESCWTPDCG